MIVCVTMNSSKRDSGRERLAFSRAERERERAGRKVIMMEMYVQQGHH